MPPWKVCRWCCVRAGVGGACKHVCRCLLARTGPHSKVWSVQRGGGKLACCHGSTWGILCGGGEARGKKLLPPAGKSKRRQRLGASTMMQTLWLHSLALPFLPTHSLTGKPPEHVNLKAGDSYKVCGLQGAGGLDTNPPGSQASQALYDQTMTTLIGLLEQVRRLQRTRSFARTRQPRVLRSMGYESAPGFPMASIRYYFPLLVLMRICHCWKYVVFVPNWRM